MDSIYSNLFSIINFVFYLSNRDIYKLFWFLNGMFYIIKLCLNRNVIWKNESVNFFSNLY